MRGGSLGAKRAPTYPRAYSASLGSSTVLFILLSFVILGFGNQKDNILLLRSSLVFFAKEQKMNETRPEWLQGIESPTAQSFRLDRAFIFRTLPTHLSVLAC